MKRMMEIDCVDNVFGLGTKASRDGLLPKVRTKYTI